VEALLSYATLRLRAEALGIVQADVAGAVLHLRFGAEAPLPPAGLVDLVRSRPGASLTPQGILRIPFASPPGPLASVTALIERLEAVGRASAL
jgi:hypothetical protein